MIEFFLGVLKVENFEHLMDMYKISATLGSEFTF